MVELVIAVAILATVTGIGIVAYRDALERARVTRTTADIRVLEKDLAIYKVDTERLPDSLAELGRGDRLDAWGRSFEYVRFCEPGETRGGEGRGGRDRDRDRDGGGRDRNGGRDRDEDRDRDDRDGDRRGDDGWERVRDAEDRGGRDRDERDRDERDRDERDRDGRERGERDRNGRGRDDEGDDCESRQGKMRRDRFLKPLNSDYDLYSRGKDGKSKRSLSARQSWDDIIRAVDGMYVGLASEF